MIFAYRVDLILEGEAMRMLMMGAPGSGKGTQSEILAKKLNIPTISTGAMLREAIANGTEVGKEAAMYINDGKLVPDETIINVVLERIAKDDCKNGYILDGFPRTLAQAEAMDKAGIETDVALMIDITEEEIIRRLAGRVVCSKCPATYHVTDKPSKAGDKCEVCGADLITRDDDKPETILNRLKIYNESTAPVIKYFENKLVKVMAQEKVSDVTDAIMKALGV